MNHCKDFKRSATYRIRYEYEFKIIDIISNYLIDGSKDRPRSALRVQIQVSIQSCTSFAIILKVDRKS